MMADNVFIHDSADKVPPAPPGRHPLTPISGADFVPPIRRRWPAQAWMLLSVVVLLPLARLLWRLDSALRDLFWRYPWLSDGLLTFVLGAAVLTVLGALVTLGARAWVGVQQARIVRSPSALPSTSWPRCGSTHMWLSSRP